MANSRNILQRLWLIFILIPVFAHGAVYDCFIFYNEIELLKMRLEELDPVVDYFVLVESAETHRWGDPKPFYFAESKHVFEEYLHKIIHVAVDERHPEMGAWGREGYQRDCMLRGLKSCKADDIILISDVDEIPRASCIRDFLQNARYLKRLKTAPIALEMSIYFYQLNRQTKDKRAWDGTPWIGTAIATYQNFAKWGPQNVRCNKNGYSRILGGGWHFTWMGGMEQILKKMVSVSEGTDHETVARTSQEALQRWIEEHPVVPIDDLFPEYVRKNQAYLRSIGYLAE